MIEINNLTTNPVDEEFLKKIAKEILESEDKKASELSIALVGQGRIRELNKRYRGRNSVTDVLAFPDREIGLGEIVICLREIKKNAKRYGAVEETKVSSSPSLNSVRSVFEKELARVLIHGILHLLGYDHEKSELDTEKMREKEEYYLTSLKIRGRRDKSLLPLRLPDRLPDGKFSN